MKSLECLVTVGSDNVGNDLYGTQCDDEYDIGFVNLPYFEKPRSGNTSTLAGKSYSPRLQSASLSSKDCDDGDLQDGEGKDGNDVNSKVCSDRTEYEVPHCRHGCPPHMLTELYVSHNAITGFLQRNGTSKGKAGAILEDPGVDGVQEHEKGKKGTLRGATKKTVLQKKKGMGGRRKREDFQGAYQHGKVRQLRVANYISFYLITQSMLDRKSLDRK
jgi:hypothetical protein